MKINEILGLNLGGRWGDTELVKVKDDKVGFRSRTLSALKDAEKEAKKPTRKPTMPTGKVPPKAEK